MRTCLTEEAGCTWPAPVNPNITSVDWIRKFHYSTYLHNLVVVTAILGWMTGPGKGGPGDPRPKAGGGRTSQEDGSGVGRQGPLEAA